MENNNSSQYRNQKPSRNNQPSLSSQNISADDRLVLEEQKRIREYINAKKARRRREQAQRRLRRNRICALGVVVAAVLIIVGVNKIIDNKLADNSSGATGVVSVKSKTTVTEAPEKADSQEQADVTSASSNTQSAVESQPEHNIETKDGLTFVDGILIVNKTYSLPSTYAPGLSSVAYKAFTDMSAAASKDGIYLFINSGYRSYDEQVRLYNTYVSGRGTDETDKVSSRPGHSEHQTGLTFDVNSTEMSFEYTPEAKWLAEHCDEYGFIIRFPKGKEDKTGYAYEPWHIRYLGTDIAKKVTDSGLCLEEYLGITSDYADCADYCEDSSQAGL